MRKKNISIEIKVIGGVAVLYENINKKYAIFAKYGGICGPCGTTYFLVNKKTKRILYDFEKEVDKKLSFKEDPYAGKVFILKQKMRAYGKYLYKNEHNKNKR